jgi:hypothetical protein
MRGVYWGVPPMPPCQLFSAGAEIYYFKSQRGMLRGVDMPPCFESAGSYAPYAPIVSE